MPKVTFDQILYWLIVEVQYCRAHVAITKGLGKADKAVLKTAPRFFRMTYGAHADCGAITAAKIFDRNSHVSFHTLLSTALRDFSLFKHGSEAEVRKLVDEAKIFLKGAEPTVVAIRTRRDKTLAHLDAGPIVSPEPYKLAGRFTYSDLDRLLEESGKFLNKFCQLYNGRTFPLDFEDVNDYQRVFDALSM
jgi:AbiU2